MIWWVILIEAIVFALLFTGIVFIGATLWTDFKLYGEDFQIWDMQNAIKYMNDYRYNHYENDEMIRLLRPEDTLNMFNKSFEFIKNTVEKFKDKKIVVITHHAPSIKSIHSKYLNGYANACYASNLEQFILDNPNIKLWVHGHVHNKHFKGDDHHLNCCAEAIDNTPVNLLKLIKEGLLKNIPNIHKPTIAGAVERKKAKETKNNAK